MKGALIVIGMALFCGEMRDTGPVKAKPGEDPGPVAVTKKERKKVFVHLMPWFETKATNIPAGTWGTHWTMDNCSPDSMRTDGRRQIASYYYPLTGPYASGDTDIIEYQLLLMKYAGIDGVCIDWPGTTQLYDYPLLVRNTEKVIAKIGQTGLHYAIVYEDQDINIGYRKGVLSDRIAAAQKDMRYLESRYFADSNYEHFQGRPLLLVFGPQTFEKEEEWTDIFHSLPDAPAFFTLWNHQEKAGKNATGAFAWINPDNLSSLRRFYDTGNGLPYIAAAYPGFRTYYEKGGWGGPTFVIDNGGLRNFSQTLDLALGSKAAYVQLPTWNDYGEGTMIEPTREFQYGFLTTLQERLGVPFTQNELELVTRLYTLRKQYAGNDGIQHILDQSASYLVSLQTQKAAQTMLPL